jgi:hypothetical protein
MSLRRRGRTISDRLPATPFRLPTVFRVNAVRAVPAGSFPALYGYFADSGRMISIVRPESLFPGVGNPVAWGKCLDYEEGVSSTCVIVRSSAGGVKLYNPGEIVRVLSACEIRPWTYIIVCRNSFGMHPFRSPEMTI